MRLLLDTQAFLWFMDDHPHLSRRARRRIEDARNDRFLSIASVWEIAIKVGIGKLRVPRPLDDFIEKAVSSNAILPLEIATRHAIAVADLPLHHADPFDRILIAQAMMEDMWLVARDEAFDAYGIRRIW